jgi:Fuc2NAc and GlcNAc transferase
VAELNIMFDLIMPGKLCGLCSWGLIKVFRGWALEHRLLDHPNERSSHDRPTPRGGGVGIVLVVCIFGGAASSGFAGLTWILAGALLIAAVSWLDDIRRGLSPLIRLIAHAGAAGLALRGMSGWERLDVFFLDSITPGWLSYLVAAVWIVGLVNAYNFMDGIDGLAGIQAVTASAGWLVVGLLSGSRVLAAAGVVIGSSAVGFLLHNWPPAKIFMGDIGSAFLGYAFAVIPLCAGRVVPESLAGRVPFAGVLMVAPFVLDAAFTFLRRLVKGERLVQAHRSHIYQRLVITGFSHRGVTLIYGALGLLTSAAGVAFVLIADKRAADLTAAAGLAACFAALLCLVTKREGRVSR